VSIVLYHGSGAGDFELRSLEGSPGFAALKSIVRDLLQARGDQQALDLLARYPFDLLTASNHFNDDFDVLHAFVPIDLYEDARLRGTSVANRGAFYRIAETFTEVGSYVRFIAVDLDALIKAEPKPEPEGLTRSEIYRLVNKYIGVNSGYLGDFSYQKHHDFYVELDLDINPYAYTGTTRQRFLTILSEAAPGIQARILQGILERYPVNSSELRTQSAYDQICTWIRRLNGKENVNISLARVTRSPGAHRETAVTESVATQAPTRGVNPSAQLRVFLCHSIEDKPAVRDLYGRLQADGFAPWLDEEDLLPGQDWKEEIPKAVRRSAVVIVCLSNNSITKEGYIQREIRFALDVEEEKPPGTIFIIPVRLDAVEIPERLGKWQCANLFEAGGYERLARALHRRALKL